MDEKQLEQLSEEVSAKIAEDSVAGELQLEQQSEVSDNNQ